MMSRLIEHDGRWIRALLILATLTVGLVFIGLAADVVVYFSDIILIVVMAWVFAFVLNPVVDGAGRVAPVIPRIVVVVVVYGLLFVILAALGLIIATQLANSIIAFTDELPTLQQRVPEIVDPWQAWLADLGLQVDLVVVLDQGLQELARSSGQFVGPLQDVAFASLGMLGNLIFMIFLSLFIVADKDNLLGFVNRVTPPQYAPEMRLFQTSVASSFGGFMRGQAIQAVVLGSVAAAGSLLLDLDYMPLTTALVAVFQFIPFFGPFISWAPPVIAAILTQPEAIIPIVLIMGAGWFVTMNFVQPRVMSSSVGIHPVVVLLSVLIGLRLQGVVGAIFAIPVAAVISAFFFHYLYRRRGGPRDVTSRAARRLEEREGHPVRVPSPPVVGAPPGGPGTGPAIPTHDHPDFDEERA
jgi:predicted PurR-regulated permease PerM